MADIVLLPSLIEGISISILEAMALGKTVVATNVGGTPEIIKNGSNGILIESKSSDGILKTLSNIKDIDNTNIGQRAKKLIEKNFFSDKMFKNYYQVFKNIKNENK